MEINLGDRKKAIIRPYEEIDFPAIQALNKTEGWNHLAENHVDARQAWKNSNVAYVVETAGREVVGYVRGFTDTRISLFICELLTDKQYRGQGVGKAILDYLHQAYPTTRMELLANRSSRSFYEALGFRSFYGFRKGGQE